MTTEEERKHNRVCGLAIQFIGKTINSMEIDDGYSMNDTQIVGQLWTGLTAIHSHCKAGLDKGIHDDKYLPYSYLNIIMEFDNLVEKLEKKGVTFSDIDIENIK